MSESTLSLSFDDFAAEVGFFLGLSRDITSFSGSTWTEAGSEKKEVYDIVNAGYRKFLYPTRPDGRRSHEWSFLRPVSTLTLSAPYSTGTITVASGVVTLADGTFPTWAADGHIVCDGSYYEVSTRDGDTQVTLTDTSVDVDAGTSYSLERLYYSLPDDFAYVRGDMLFSTGVTNYSVTKQPEAYIRRLRSASAPTGRPYHYAERPIAATAGTTGQRFEALFYPTPDIAYTLTYQYAVLVSVLDATNKYPLGGAVHGETIMESCLAVAEQRTRDSAGIHTDLFDRHLVASIALDGQHASDFAGRMSDGSGDDSLPSKSSIRLFYEGSEFI